MSSIYLQKWICWCLCELYIQWFHQGTVWGFHVWVFKRLPNSILEDLPSCWAPGCSVWEYRIQLGTTWKGNDGHKQSAYLPIAELTIQWDALYIYRTVQWSICITVLTILTLTPMVLITIFRHASCPWWITLSPSFRTGSLHYEAGLVCMFKTLITFMHSYVLG